MPLLSADPRVTRSSRSATAESRCPAGTTWLTRPQSSAVPASMTSPDRAISMDGYLSADQCHGGAALNFTDHGESARTVAPVHRHVALQVRQGEVGCTVAA